MSGDLLAIEYFLLPGTYLMIDGRTANAVFLRNNFQREWIHRHDFDADVHHLELIESPLGAINKREIDWRLHD